MNKSFAYLAIAALGLLAACKKEAAPTNITNLTATLDGTQQVPANNSTAGGLFTGSYDGNSKILTYSVTYRGLTPTAGHIHSGAPGMTGPISIAFSGLASPITGTAYLSLDQINDLLNNHLYVNLHSSAFPNGEIRGDIHK